MKKAYFADQLVIEMVSDKWLGNKIKVYVKASVFIFLIFIVIPMNSKEYIRRFSSVCKRKHQLIIDY
ncbi:hypothetical protein [Chryseobacterium carnipullorum]|uniref:hypothetical protein n=1 Tax=Chryseobacterium carnipullorum TaxID=1124835 RepID=UPI0011148C17|nr:hypothetical protein [Chryseobacterium carnipullorum]